MRFRAALAFFLLAVGLVLAATACGGGGGGGKSSDSGGSVPDGADFVVSSALGYATIDTDFEGDGWKTLDDLASKFPDREKLLAQLRAQLRKQNVSWEELKTALGPETDVGILDNDNGLFLTVPKDVEAFKRLARKVAGKSPAFFKDVGDWVAASDKLRSVNSAERAHEGSSLADSDAVKQAFGELGGDAIARIFVDGKAFNELSDLASAREKAPPKLPGVGRVEWLAGAVQANSSGVRFSAVTKSQPGTASGLKTYEPKLVDEVPAGVLAYISFNDVATLLRQLQSGQFSTKVKELEQQLGVTIDQLVPLLQGEGAIYVRPAALLPEVTVLLSVTDEAAARSTADILVPKLAEGFGLTGAPTTTTVEGVDLKAIRGENFSIYWGIVDGKLLITNSTTAVTGLKDGDKLSDDSSFKDARDAGEMPDQVSGFVYLNLKDIVPILQNFVSTSSAKVPEGLFENLAPLRSLLLYGTFEDGQAHATGFLGID
jgi:hypothetical protein